MFILNSYEVQQERHKDLLREAEKARLIKQALAGRPKSAVWQRISDLFSRADDEQSSVTLMKLQNADTGACCK